MDTRLLRDLRRLLGAFLILFAKDAEDSFQIMIKSEEWSGKILPAPYPYASSINYTISLNRPFDKKMQKWSGLTLESVFDLNPFDNISATDVERHCFSGTANLVHVVPKLSDIPSKFKLAAIKKLNRAHDGDKGHVHNPRWERLILGQDLRTNTKGNLFAGIDFNARLREWKITLSDSQLHALKYLGNAPNNLGLIVGAWGTGKINLDVIVTLLLMSANKKVKILSPTNKAADSFIIKLNTEIARIKDAEMQITDKNVVRFRSPTTENAVVRDDRKKFAILDTTNARWQPNSTRDYLKFVSKESAESYC